LEEPDFYISKLFFLFRHGFYASGADIEFFAVYFFNLQVNILAFYSFYIGMGSGGVFS